jgi:hypothetical protein
MGNNTNNEVNPDMKTIFSRLGKQKYYFLVKEAR